MERKFRRQKSSGSLMVLGSLLVMVSGLVLGACASSAQEERSTTQVSGGFAADEADLQREIDHDEVARFARAYIEVMAVQQQYYSRARDAEPSRRAELVAEEEERVEAIIASYEMTTSSFNAIVVRLPTDDELRRRVQIEIQAQEEERLQTLREEAQREE